ncbi:MAG: glycosyltransferase [Proteobacteria bacterium]|nr:MAG: glycosyltransferase [Pseudomonadota bacterium]
MMLRSNNFPPGISVVLPNYNGKHLMEKNIPSILKALDQVDMPWEIIVVDDSSTDDSIVFLQSCYPQISVVASSVNRGFSTTCNNGIARAKYKYTCISNTDVTFAENYFEVCISALEKGELFAVKGSIVNYIDDPGKVLNIERSTLMFFKRGFFKFKTREEIPGKGYKYELSKLGCCFVCRTSDLWILDGFDEIFTPYYWEDCDLAVRAIKSGMIVKYLPEAIVWHQLSSTIGAHRSRTNRKIVSNRNKFIFTWRHMDTAMEWRVHLLFLAGSLLTRWVAMDWQYYVGLFYAVGRLLGKRREKTLAFYVTADQ